VVQVYVGSLGHYDPEAFVRSRILVRELVPMNESGAVIAELEEVSGPVQGKSYFSKFYRWGRK